MTYQELLSDQRWSNKRNLILERDNFSCQMKGCNKMHPEHLGTLKAIFKLTEVLTPSDNAESRLLNDITSSTKSIIIENKYSAEPGKIFKETIPIISQLPNDIDITNIVIYYFEPNFETNSNKSFIEKILLKQYATYGEIIQTLNVHHKKYIKGRKPWEYNDDDLITYCCDCHKEVHNKEHIPVLNENGHVIGTTEKCWKCNGAGYLNEYYYHYGGNCFACLGEGISLYNLL